MSKTTHTFLFILTLLFVSSGLSAAKYHPEYQSHPAYQYPSINPCIYQDCPEPSPQAEPSPSPSPLPSPSPSPEAVDAPIIDTNPGGNNGNTNPPTGGTGSQNNPPTNIPLNASGGCSLSRN